VKASPSRGDPASSRRVAGASNRGRGTFRLLSSCQML
jgi:hypothetical protein